MCPHPREAAAGTGGAPGRGQPALSEFQGLLKISAALPYQALGGSHVTLKQKRGPGGVGRGMEAPAWGAQPGCLGHWPLPRDGPALSAWDAFPSVSCRSPPPDWPSGRAVESNPSPAGQCISAKQWWGEPAPSLSLRLRGGLVFPKDTMSPCLAAWFSRQHGPAPMGKQTCLSALLP